MAPSTRASAFIAGRFVRGTGATRELVRRNPGRTTEVVSRFPIWPGAVEEAVVAARAAQPAWSAMSQGARTTILRRFAHLTSADAEPLARLITRESGKPLWEAREEVSLAVRKVEVTLGAGLARVRTFKGGSGAEALLEGRRVRRRWPGYYVSPAVHLVHKANSRSRYQNEEIFGPDVAVYVVDDIEEAATLADATEYGLALSVFTRSRRKLDPFFRLCRVGILNWNRSTVGASAALPFGGQRRSGNDRPTALFAVDSCTYPVAMLEGGAGRSGSAPPGFPEM